MQSDGFGNPLIMATCRVVLLPNNRANEIEVPSFEATSFRTTRIKGRIERLRPVRL